MRAESFRSIVARFPQREFDVRRRCAHDAHFRSICTDYEEATTALRRWRNAGANGGHKADDYARFLNDLEAEILALLDEPVPSP